MYRHPQGAIAVVHPDGAVEKFTATGVRNPKTSATAEKLASGHGRWERISNASPGLGAEHAASSVVPAPTVPEVERKSVPVPSGSRYRKPMDFNEAPVEDIPKYAADLAYHFQQKVDGVRAQLVIEPGKKPWFRSKAGEQLQSTTAAPVTRAILDHIGQLEGGQGYTVDGEIVNGKWHVFDMTVDGETRVPWETRMDRAKAWADAIGSDRVSALPVAKTKQEKLALAHAVRASGGEGVMMKRRDAGYDYGSRVSHSLKAKYVSTADVVVTKLRPDGKDSAEISVYDHGVLKRVGTVPLGGREKAEKVHEGDVIEVNYLYAMPGTHNMVQARMVKRRPDKRPNEATTDQLRKVSKDVLDREAIASGRHSPRRRPGESATEYALRTGLDPGT